MGLKEKDQSIYYKELESVAKKLNSEEKDLALSFIKYIKSDYSQKQKCLCKFKDILNNDTTILIKVSKKLFGDYYGEFFNYIVKHAVEYPYSSGYYRRPFRTAEFECHIDNLIEMMKEIAGLYRYEFSIIDYLTITDYNIYNNSISRLIAYEIDNDNSQVIDALKEIIYGDNNAILLSHIMIEGIFLSHNKEMYKWLGELLIAAKLQEGLRQSIVEKMDQGTLDAMMYMLKIIIDNDFIRYSSVVRALAVWTGMDLEAVNTRITKQCIGYAYETLMNELTCQEWLASDDKNKLYMALWATAVKEEENLYPIIDELMKDGKDYQKITTQYFLAQSQNDELRFEVSYKWLEQSEMELQYWTVYNYNRTCSYGYSWKFDEETDCTIYLDKVDGLKSKKIRIEHFNIFKNILLSMSKKEINFNSKVFEWLNINFSVDLVVNRMMYIAAYDMDAEFIEELLKLKELISPDTRADLLKYFVKDENNGAQRKFIFDCLGDKSTSNRQIALTKIKTLKLTDEEIEKLLEILKLKTGSLRQAAVKLILGLENNKLEKAVDILISSKNELQRLGALEVIVKIKENKEQKYSESQYDSLKKRVSLIETPSEKEKVLIDSIYEKEEYSIKNGFGLFDNTALNLLEDPKLYEEFNLNKLFVLSVDKIKNFLGGLSNLVHKYREYEYEIEWYSGYKQTYLVGERLESPYRRNDENKKDIEWYPLSEVWMKYLEDSGLGVLEVIEIGFYFGEDELYKYYFNKLDKWRKDSYKALDVERKKFIETAYPVEKIKEVFEYTNGLKYYMQVNSIIRAFVNDLDKKALFDLYNKILNNIMYLIKTQNTDLETGFLSLISSPWINHLSKYYYDDESFKQYFYLDYKIYKLRHFNEGGPGLSDFIRAYELEIIDENEIYRELMVREYSHNHISTITNPKRDFISKYPAMQKFKDNVIERILEIELKRGDLSTEVSRLAMNIEYYEGMNYFVDILSRLDKETFVRGYIYGYYGNNTKKEAFSKLLKNCYPKLEEDEKLLRKLLNGKKISDKRLLEAAMYAPQWIEIVSRYLNWQGLRSAAWYFHAHVNETFSAEKETIIAHYSPITPADFNDGAFDTNWFKEAYNRLGEERFKILYDCAKYISGGSNHRRSQLFADATLGKLKLEELKKSAEVKRNKDHLLCISLVPIEKTDIKDLLGRYEFIQKFLKESKKFGAQRRASEEKAGSIALNNLARTAGYSDVIRLTWDMETEKVRDIIDYLDPMEIDKSDEVKVQLVIDKTGSVDIKTTKKDKVLKSLPSKYNKNEYVLKLKEVKSDLRDQYRRAKAELERSMESESIFTLKEMKNLTENPVISPIISMLVLKAGNNFGYFANGKLEGVNGESYKIKANDKIIIAHPIHLYESGNWSDYQKDIFERQITQPFKQVFRELYIPNEDELESGTISRRYAGHQVQPKKTVALLKTRSWTVSYEEGLQKVYYKENIIAKIYAAADWFSPSDVESPTLETVGFFDRNTYKSVKIKDIPKIIFSEIMRDVDLVVSVAHVGGVDPEASLSTVDMRRAIVKESLRLMKIENVRLEGNYAHIKGTLGEYSVHLGSAMAYKQASGSLYIIPVHSQHRGRVFLPFIDEDPKTAEVLSKIMMLSQDTKIKDPSILEQIK